MPGLYGYVKVDRNEDQILNMKKCISYTNNFFHDTIFNDKNIQASRFHIGNIGPKNTPITQNGIHIWIEGEIYNLAECISIHNLHCQSFEELILESYQQNILNSVLNHIDGYFCATIYDSNDESLFLFSDRYGLKPLYLYNHNGRFAWSSEVKAFLSLDFLDKSIDFHSAQCFLGLGHLLENHTWFQHIKLIAPSSIYHYNINTEKLTRKYYWKWSEIRPSNISFDTAVKMLSYLMIQAVKKRFNPSENIGIPLSGGLDSRMIIAAINKLYPDFHGQAYTFGIDQCIDIKIAKQVTAKSNWKHELFFFDSKNWLPPRIDKVWITDGMQNILHMHGCEFHSSISSICSISLSGYLGDAILGTSYLDKIKLHDQKISLNLAKAYYKEFVSDSDIDNTYYDINHIEPFLLMNRGRRFINMGTINGLSWIDRRKPFLDNQLIEFIFSVPDHYRKAGLYNKSLMNIFPKFFKNIPWSKTGNPIASDSRLTTNNYHKNKNYTDYPNWIRDRNIYTSLSDYLDMANTHFSNILDIDFFKNLLAYHIKNKHVDYSDQILRAVTSAIYLNKVLGYL